MKITRKDETKEHFHIRPYLKLNLCRNNIIIIIILCICSHCIPNGTAAVALTTMHFCVFLYLPLVTSRYECAGSWSWCASLQLTHTHSLSPCMSGMLFS